MSDNFKSIITEILASSTSHGIPNIIRSTKLSIRLMWIGFTLISTGLCAYLIAKNLFGYLDFETTTKIRVLTEFVSDAPTITICNNLFFTSPKSIELLNETKNLTISYTYPLDYDKYFILKDLVFKNPSLKSDIYNYGDTFEKLILTCELSSFSCIDKSLWSFYFHNTYGNCYQVNTNSSIKVTQAGRLHGINLILNVSVPDELDSLNPVRGAVVFIHNKTESPTQADGIYAAVGMETNIAVSRTFHKQMPKPYSNCDGNTDDPLSFDSKFYKLIHANKLKYNQKLCTDFCLQDLIVDKCGCYYTSLSYYGNNESIKACLDDIQYECVSYFQSEFLTNLDLLKEFCLPLCPLECEGMFFEITYSTADFMNDNWNAILNRYYNFSGREKRNFKKELVSLKMYYKSLSYTEISEKESIDIAGLLSNIGGIAGLFLGVSVLSFVELIEILLETIRFYATKRPKKNKIFT
ncbi:unnamed protein product [Brachionus calyciflorus]|uniref:Uncharacterized protein n=1 Tax=Brachionus calyciflorus TaxID=104777 RepID=A0A814H0M1_9BILA|nr:unnamed protein product [Brachionus calyciflorus]